MRKLVLLTALLLGPAPSWAADNYQVKDANSATVTIKSKDTGGGVESPQVVPSDASGNPVTGSAGAGTTSGITIQGMVNGQPVQVNISAGVSQQGTWTVQPGNTPNTVPWLQTISQGGNAAVVAPGASPYGAALSVAGGITPATATSSAPLSSPILAAVTTPGGTTSVPGQLNIPVMTTGSVLSVSPTAQPVGGATPYHLAGGSAAASTNSTLIVTGPHTLYALEVSNPTTVGLAYLRLYDTATAPTCSSATGAVGSLGVPTNTTSGGDYDYNIGPMGLKFSNGIGFCITLKNSDTDATVMPAAGVVVNGAYN